MIKYMCTLFINIVNVCHPIGVDVICKGSDIQITHESNHLYSQGIFPSKIYFLYFQTFNLFICEEDYE